MSEGEATPPAAKRAAAANTLLAMAEDQISTTQGDAFHFAPAKLGLRSLLS